MSVTKKFFLGIFIAFMSFCILADGLYLAIKYFFPTKMVSTTFNVGNLTKKNEDGESKVIAPIFEINYYANEDGSGVELFDLKLNTLKNEESEAVFSTGLQIVGGDEKIDAKWIQFSHYDNFWGTYCERKYKLKFNSSIYYYNVDGNNASYIASLPIEDDDYFLITIGDELFRMHIRKSLSDDKTKLEPYYHEEFLNIKNLVLVLLLTLMSMFVKQHLMQL